MICVPIHKSKPHTRCVCLIISSFSLSVWMAIFLSLSFLAGCGGVEATAREKSSYVPWESMCLGEGSSWVSQQQTAGTWHWSHAQQLCSWCVSEMYSLYTECEVYWGVCKTSNLLRIKVVVDVCGNCFAFDGTFFSLRYVSFCLLYIYICHVEMII